MMKEANNCCNGRVGKQLAELAELQKDELIRQVVLPTGVEMIRKAKEIGIELEAASNCCNGRVGRRAGEELME